MRDASTDTALYAHSSKQLQSLWPRMCPCTEGPTKEGQICKRMSPMDGSSFVEDKESLKHLD